MPKSVSSSPITTPLAKPSAIVSVLAAAGVLVSLAQTLIIPLIGELPTLFNTSAATASWIITITLLTGAIFTPITGRLADMYGKKLVLLICLGFFIIGSALAAAASGVSVMIVGRGLQGVASGMVPLGISILHDLLPREKAGKAIALMSSSMGIGGAMGLPIAAAIAQYGSWRILFITVALLGFALGMAITWILPSSHNPRTQERFDYYGAVGLASGIGVVLLAVSKGAEWGWSSVLTLTLVISGLVVLIGWGIYQSKVKAPLINLRTAALKPVLLTNLASILIGFTMFALNLLVPPIMQLPVSTGFGLGQSMLAMGVWIMPVGLGMMAVSGLGANISSKRTPRVTLILAGMVAALGYGTTGLILATIGNRTPGSTTETAIVLTIIALSAAGIIVGGGIGLAFGSIPALIMMAAPKNEIAAANGVNALMRSLGTTSASTVLGMLLAANMTTVSGVQTPTLNTYLLGLGITTVIALLGSLLAFLVPPRVFSKH